MTRSFFTLLLLCLFNSSCQPDKPNQINRATKDSILNRYLSIVDTLPYYDTNSVELKILKAYSLNDTNTLKVLVGHFENMNTKVDWEITLDSCVKQQAFKDINAEEKYRFKYTAAFCPYATSATVVKNKDSIMLSIIVYQYAWDTIPCKVISQTTITIDSLRWDEFQASLEVADFWGLKPDNGKRGVDGSTLEVYGFKKATNLRWDSDKLAFISRWSPANSSILSSFVLLLKYSKTQKGCLTAL